MAVAVAMMTQCLYCIVLHVGKARRLSCTDQELVEEVLVSATLRAVASVTHGTHALDVAAPTAGR